MRILHVIPQLWRGNGAAKIVKDLVDYQITHGNLVTVVSLSIMSPSYEKDLKKLGCEVIYLENRRYSLYNPSNPQLSSSASFLRLNVLSSLN